MAGRLPGRLPEWSEWDIATRPIRAPEPPGPRSRTDYRLAFVARALGGYLAGGFPISFGLAVVGHLTLSRAPGVASVSVRARGGISVVSARRGRPQRYPARAHRSCCSAFTIETDQAELRARIGKRESRHCRLRFRPHSGEARLEAARSANLWRTRLFSDGSGR